MSRKWSGVLVAAALVLAACGGGSEGDTGAFGDSIGVAGYWKIDIVNPDGTVDRHVEFHNEFVGQEILARILSNDSPTHGWGVAVAGVAAICFSFDQHCRGAGTATHDTTTDDLVITGDTTAAADGDIAMVYGEVTDDAGAIRPFSQKSLATADGGPGVIPVAAGQIIQVEIRYSFSTV